LSHGYLLHLHQALAWVPPSQLTFPSPPYLKVNSISQFSFPWFSLWLITT
jgi:hypothetical protein